MVRLGLDVGGTKIEIIALSESGVELLRERVVTPQGDYDKTLAAIAQLIYSTEQALGVSECSVGMGVPGSLSPTTGLMRNANSTCLNGQPLKQDIESLLKRKVRLSNDANCLALSEGSDGVGQGAESVFAVIVGTGTGAGYVCSGKLVDGHNGIAGEWGHNPMPWMSVEEYPGSLCWCGLHGCIETFLCGSGLAGNYKAGILTAEAVVALADKGDMLAQLALDKYAQDMAKALAHVINMLDPEVIVLGGGLSNIQSLYRRVPELWGQYVFSDKVRTRLCPPVHGDSSGVRGAAWLW